MTHGSAARLAALCALTFGCGGLAASGAIADIGDQFQANECAQVLERVREYSPFLADHPSQLAEAHLYKGKCLQRMGREAEAAAAYRYVAEQHPETPFGYEARALLSLLEEQRQ